MWGPDRDPWAEAGPGEVIDVLVGDQATAVDGDDAVGGPRGLLGVRRGVQNGPAPARMGLQQSVHPTALAWSEAFRRIVEDECVRIAQQRRSEGEASVHAKRE